MHFLSFYKIIREWNKIKCQHSGRSKGLSPDLPPPSLPLGTHVHDNHLNPFKNLHIFKYISSMAIWSIIRTIFAIQRKRDKISYLMFCCYITGDKIVVKHFLHFIVFAYFLYCFLKFSVWFESQLNERGLLGFLLNVKQNISMSESKIEMQEISRKWKTENEYQIIHPLNDSTL